MSSLIETFFRRFRGWEPLPDGFTEKTQQSATGARFEVLKGVINDMEIMNQSHYKGRACKVCGSTTRYKKSRRCVECKHALSVAEWERVKASKTANTEK
ncbi:hypothetical protein VEE21_47120 (plasmid) [Escherichia coli]|nr:hypothetical protein VEE21_47120 [Escherichia coli]